MVTIRVDGHTIKDVDLFVFDKDGTLINLYCYWASMVRLRAEKICEHYQLALTSHCDALMERMGVDVHNHRLKPDGPVGLSPRAIVQKAAEDYLLQLGLPDIVTTCTNVFNEVDELSSKKLSEFIVPIEGAVELLIGIKSCGGKIAVVTSDKKERAQLAMEYLGVAKMVDIVVGADQVKHSKPAPDLLYFVESELGVDLSRSVMIGDAHSDIEMGKNAGCKAVIAVASGLTNKEELLKITSLVVNDVSMIEVLN